MARHCLCDPEVEHFHRAVGADFDVRGFQIPVHDAILVCGIDRLGDLPGDLHCVIRGNRRLSDPLFEGQTFDELEHQRPYAAALLEAVDVPDVRVIHRGERHRLALKTPETIGIGRELLGQDLDGDVAIELRVAGAIDLAHPAGAESPDDFVGT